MKKFGFGGVACLVLALAVGAQATTNFWITNDPNGAALSVDPVSGLPELKVDPNTAFTVYTFFSTTDTGSGLEMFLGYDKSDATRQGIGYDTNNGAYKKLVLTSTEAEITASINPLFNSLHAAHIDASARETSNTLIGGRPYGVQIQGVTSQIGTFEATKVATFNFTNSLAATESAYIVLSNNGSGASFTDYWSNGSNYIRPSYALKVTATPEPVSLVLLAIGGLGLLRKRR
jgi:hypothetical protein